MPKNPQRVKTQYLKITQALSSKTDKPTASLVCLQVSYSEFLGEEFSPCSSKCIHASYQIGTASVQLSRKILPSNTPTQAADRKGFPKIITSLSLLPLLMLLCEASDHGFFCRFKNFQKLYSVLNVANYLS